MTTTASIPLRKPTAAKSQPRRTPGHPRGTPPPRRTPPLRLVYIDPAELAANPNNWRDHPAAQKAALVETIDSVGWAGALLFNDRTKRLIDGHARKELFAGKGPVPVLIGSWTEAQEKQILATLDPLAAMAEANRSSLATLLADLQPSGAAVQAMLDDLAKRAGLAKEELVQDEVPEPPDNPTTQPGDLWVLGNHRLLCGDSSPPADVDRLLAGSPIHLVNSDPPYNVRVEPRSNNAIAAGNSSFAGTKHHQSLDLVRHPNKSKPTGKMRAKDRPLANDFVSDADFERLLHAWFGNMARVLLPGHGFYIWGGYANCGNYPPVLKACKLYFSQAIIWVKEHPVLTRKDFMGNHEWCQPPDTLVLTPSGTSRLSALRDQDRVVSFYAHSSAIVGLRDGFEVQVGQRPYEGKLYGVTVGPRQSWCTDGHLWTVRLSADYSRKWCVYLMRRGSWWRVGVTKMRTTWGFGLKGRLCGEHGDDGWILSLHDTHAEARIREQLVSVQFGVPQTCWKESPNANRRQYAHVADLYACLDLDQLERAANTVLAAYHRCREYPFVRSDETRSKYGARQSIQVRACNLLPEIMEVPVPTGGQQTDWQSIRAVDVQSYSGQVHSLGVPQHQHYIADGLVTHNCFYGWREGAAHRFYGPANVPDVWSVKKINPQNMIHLTEKPVELAARAMHYSTRPQENVLDLFGGSGSTLIAAEQLDRRAFLMELDPAYCDVIVERWSKLTGHNAKLERRT